MLAVHFQVLPSLSIYYNPMHKIYSVQIGWIVQETISYRHLHWNINIDLHNTVTDTCTVKVTSTFTRAAADTCNGTLTDTCTVIVTITSTRTAKDTYRDLHCNNDNHLNRNSYIRPPYTTWCDRINSQNEASLTKSQIQARWKNRTQKY